MRGVSMVEIVGSLEFVPVVVEDRIVWWFGLWCGVWRCGWWPFDALMMEFGGRWWFWEMKVGGEKGREKMGQEGWG